MIVMLLAHFSSKLPRFRPLAVSRLVIDLIARFRYYMNRVAYAKAAHTLAKLHCHND